MNYLMKHRYIQSHSKQSKMAGDHKISECNHVIKNRPIHHKPAKAIEGRTTYMMLDNSGAEEKLIPSRKPTEEPVIIPRSEFRRLQKEAKVITAEQRKAMIEEAERNKNQILQESMDRKENLIKTQKIQQAVPGSKLEKEESEAASKNLYLIKRSQELQIEQDDRVKQANRIILATKCRAIRNAQLAEKKLIEDQLQEENRRLDRLMEQSRQEKVAAEEKRRAEAEISKQRYIKGIDQQMKENEMNELIEAEKLEEEARMVNKALIALQKEEEQKAIDKQKLKLRLRDEFMKATEDAEYFKSVRDEESKVMDMRIKEFQRLKQEREEAIEKEKAAKKAAFERDQLRMVEGQEKSADIKELMESLKAARAQEEKEKEWREKEKKAAEKKKAGIDDLKKSRAEQINNLRKAQAVMLSRDEEEYMKVAARQRKLHEDFVASEIKRKEDKERHRKFLLKQINEKEKERINFHMEKFEDGQAQRQEFAVKDRNIDEYLGQKVNKLRDLNIPDNYIKDIERQMKSIVTK